MARILVALALFLLAPFATAKEPTLQEVRGELMNRKRSINRVLEDWPRS